MSKGNASTGYLQNILNVSDIVKKKISKGDAFLNFIKPPCYQKYYTILKEQIEQVGWEMSQMLNFTMIKYSFPPKI